MKTLPWSPNNFIFKSPFWHRRLQFWFGRGGAGSDYVWPSRERLGWSCSKETSLKQVITIIHSHLPLHTSLLQSRGGETIEFKWNICLVFMNSASGSKMCLKRILKLGSHDQFNGGTDKKKTVFVHHREERCGIQGKKSYEEWLFYVILLKPMTMRQGCYILDETFCHCLLQDSI